MPSAKPGSRDTSSAPKYPAPTVCARRLPENPLRSPLTTAGSEFASRGVTSPFRTRPNDDPCMTASARTFAAIAVISVLLLAFAAAAWMASLHKCATVDEPSHLLAAWTQLTFGDFRADCENP